MWITDLYSVHQLNSSFFFGVSPFTQAQAETCPDGTTDFSYDWTGLGGQFPSGGALTNLPLEIAPNLLLDAWQKWLVVVRVV